MNYERIFKKAISFFRANVITILLIHLFIGYITLFIAFIMVVTECSSQSRSDWFLENFSTPKEVRTVECKLTKLLEGQESLGYEFEKVLFENLWDLYEA